jgi:hypothetical protein
MELRPPIRVVREHIVSLLDDLPPESLFVLEQFVRFLFEQAQQGQSVVSESEVQADKPRYQYPTKGVPASSLNRWLNLLPKGYEGDALADTEALYDQTSS